MEADIFEIWLSQNENIAAFSYKDYMMFSITRSTKREGSVMACVHSRSRSIMTVHSSSVSLCNSYNILYIRLQNCALQATIVVVYRPPDATAEQTIALFSDLHKSIDSSRCSV